MIEEIDLSNIGDKYNTETKGILGKLSKINIFIGKNSSGKSRLLRKLFSQIHLPIRSKGLEAQVIVDAVEDIKEFFEDFTGIDNLSLDEFAHISEQRGSLNLSNQSFKEARGLINRCKTLQSQSYSSTSTKEGNHHRVKIVAENVRTVANKALEKIADISSEDVKTWSEYSKCYIPVPRGVRRFAHDRQRDHYRDLSINDYFPNLASEIQAENSRLQVFTGLSIFDDLTNRLLGSHAERDSVRRFEDFLSTRFFAGEPTSIVPRKKEMVLYIKIGDAPEYPIYDVGDGIQSIIVILYPIFTIQEPSLFFIEEPEHYLHPGFQRILLEGLLDSNHQIFLSTHSNHLLDMTLDYQDTSLFGVRACESGDFLVRFHERPSLELLHLIGARRSSVLISNVTLWVEGLTDRIILRALFTCYNKGLEAGRRKLQEDVDFSFVEYQGSNLGHWNMMEDGDWEKYKDLITSARVCGAPFVLLDGDVTGKKDRLNTLKEQLKSEDSYHVWTGKEIENMLPRNVIRRALHETFKDSKKEGWKETSSYLDSEDFQSVNFENNIKVGIGGIIDTASGFTFLSDTPTGTVRNKKKFAEIAAKILATNEYELTDDVTLFFDKFHNFVDANLNFCSEESTARNILRLTI